MNEFWVWVEALDWGHILKFVKGVGDFKEFLTLVISSITAIALIFVRHSLRHAVTEIRGEVASIKEQLEASSAEFHRQLDGGITRLNTNMLFTLEQVDKAGDALAKKVDFVKKEIEIVIDDAFARASQIGARGEPPAVEHVEANYWDDVRQLWEQTRREIDNRVAEIAGNLTDGRRRRRYQNIDRRNYEATILKLYEDNWIDDDSSNALLEMNLLFNSRRNRKRPVSLDEFTKFLEWRQLWLMSSQTNSSLAAE